MIIYCKLGGELPKIEKLVKKFKIIIIKAISDDTNNTIAVRGPYTVSSALENESNLLRMPSDALQTLGLSYGDTVTINSIPYNINETKMGELDLLRLPMDVKEYLEVADGDILQNSRLNHIFDGAVVSHNVSSTNDIWLIYNIW